MFGKPKIWRKRWEKVMSDTATLTASLEDYLEAIFHIVERKQAARAKDISKRMHVNGSSVTGALRALSERNLVNYAPYDIVTLTAEGERTFWTFLRTPRTTSGMSRTTTRGASRRRTA